MKSRTALFMLFVLVIMLVLAACGVSAATQAPAATEAPAEFYAVEPSIVEAPAAKDGGDVGVPQDDVVGQAALAPLPTAAAYEISDPAGDLTVIERSNRMIVKNADVRLMVKDTDVAIDRATQIIGDA